MMEIRDFMIVCVCVLSGSVLSGESGSGRPAGYMADCPGMNNTTTFSERTKRSLSVVVVWPGYGLLSNERRCELSKGGAACADRHLDLKRHKTQVIISGYMDASFSPLVRSLVGPFIARKHNVIIVEVFPILVRPYPVAARVTKPLGDILGEFLAELTYRGLDPNRLEMSGGSLGAHIASFAAVKYRQLTGYKPARLTGLDPAGPCFRNLNSSQRFNPDAADKVVALHTNIDGFGIADPVAHVDFYANGGEYQPFMAGDFLLPCFLLCSHVRSAFIWLMALQNPDEFVGVRCKSLGDVRVGNCYNEPIVSNLLGTKTNFSRPGIYYLPTSATLPYHLGRKALKVQYGLSSHLTNISPEKDLIL